MTKQISACSIYDCQTCTHQKTGDCPGCLAGNTQLTCTDQGPCGVFSCVHSRGITSCEQCKEPGCVLRRTVETLCPVRSRFENIRWWAGRMSRAMECRKPGTVEGETHGKISTRVINRLRWYLTVLDSLAAEGTILVSSWQLAERVGINAALIRKDLSRFGEFGTPSSGYRVEVLTKHIRKILKLDEPNGIVWVGASCFRLHYPSIERLSKHACNVVGVFDICPEEIGARVGDYEVLPVEHLTEVVSRTGVRAAALAVSGAEAQSVADVLVALGVRAILNVGESLLVLPDSVKVRSFDMVGELLELCYYCEG